MIDLYFAPTPNAERARLALEEAGFAYNLHPIDLLKGEQRNEAFLRINPMGAVPVLIDSEGPNNEEVVLSQSIAILFYVAEKCGRFIPANPILRLSMLQWMMFSGSDVAGTNSSINQLRRSAPVQVEANVAFFEARLVRYLAVCDRRLAEHTYLAEEFSLADIALYPFVVAKLELCVDAALTHLVRWTQTMGRRPAVERLMAS